MMYGLKELIEEKDISPYRQKMIKDGAKWGCDYLRGFLEELNEERESKDRFTVLARHPGECDFGDFVFAIRNRICAVVFNVDFWGQPHLSYERRVRLIEASLEHRLMPIVVNLDAGCDPEKIDEKLFSPGERFMTDPVSGIEIFPEIGMGKDWKQYYPLDDWAAELYAKNAARQALEQQGMQVARIYPNNMFLWAFDQDGKPTWVLVSYHHAALKKVPDYRSFDKDGPNAAGKAGYGIDVAISNDHDDSPTADGCLKPIYRSWNVVAEVVSMTKLADGVDSRPQENASADVSRESPHCTVAMDNGDDARLTSGTAKEPEEKQVELEHDEMIDSRYDEYGRLKSEFRKKKSVENKVELVEIAYGSSAVNKVMESLKGKKAATAKKLAKMPFPEKLKKAIEILNKKLAKTPEDEELKKKLKTYKAYLCKLEMKKED